MVLKDDGTLWATGENNSYGQFGRGDNINRNIFVQCATDVAAFSIEKNHTVILKTDGTVWTAGGNGSGQLGTGDSVTSNTFTKVAEDAVAVWAGSATTFIKKKDGTIWATGSNNGIFGNSVATSSLEFIQVMPIP